MKFLTYIAYTTHKIVCSFHISIIKERTRLISKKDSSSIVCTYTSQQLSFRFKQQVSKFLELC